MGAGEGRSVSVATTVSVPLLLLWPLSSAVSARGVCWCVWCVCGVCVAPSCSSGNELSSVRYSLGPLHLVAMTGRAIAIASTCGRPHPSPLLGRTKASTAAYTRGRSADAMPLLSSRTLARVEEEEAVRVVAVCGSCVRLCCTKERICRSKSASEW